MRKALTVCAVLCAVILCALSGNAEGWGCADCGNPLETDSAFCPFCGAERPGDHPDRTAAPEGTASRAAAEIKPATAGEIKERLACRLASNGDVSWKPKDRQPLNVYMVVRNGSDQLLDGEIAKVSETDGLSPEYVRELTDCARVIEERSGGAIRFVEDPNQAAVQLAVRLDYEFAGKYVNDSGNVLNGYSTHLYIKAEVAVYYGSPDAKVYCMPVPDLRGTPELDELVDAVMCWFGFNPEGDSYQGMFAKALEEIRQKLYERGYLAETGDAVYDDAMREAVRQLQADYDLATTGGLDAATLAAVWYDRQSLEPMRKA